MLHGPAALDKQSFNHGFLKTCCDISAGLIILITIQPQVSGMGFQSAEAEVKTGPVGHRTRESKSLRIAVCSQFCQCWTAGVTQPQKFCRLVKRLARGIVQRLAEYPVLTDPADFHQHRMAA